MANLKKLMNFFSSQEPTVVALAEEKLENGTVLISDDLKKVHLYSLSLKKKTERM